MITENLMNINVTCRKHPIEEGTEKNNEKNNIERNYL